MGKAFILLFLVSLGCGKETDKEAIVSPNQPRACPPEYRQDRECFWSGPLNCRACVVYFDDNSLGAKCQRF